MALRARIPRDPVPRMGRVREGDDAGHLTKLRLCPCVVYGTRDRVEAHHLMHGVDGQPKGMGRKNEDRYALPLSFAAHYLGVHKAGDEEAYFSALGIDRRAIAAALWACRGKPLDAYLRVVFRSLQSRGIHIV